VVVIEKIRKGLKILEELRRKSPLEETRGGKARFHERESSYGRRVSIVFLTYLFFLSFF